MFPTVKSALLLLFKLKNSLQKSEVYYMPLIQSNTAGKLQSGLVKTSPLLWLREINRSFPSKKKKGNKEKWLDISLVFFKINRTLHGRLEVQNFSFSVQKYFSAYPLFIRIRPAPHMSGYFWIRNVFFPDSKISTSTRIRIEIEFARPHVSDMYPDSLWFTLVPRTSLGMLVTEHVS